MSGTLWRHRKRGTKYGVLGLAKMQIEIRTLHRILQTHAPNLAMGPAAVARICEALEKTSFVGYRSIDDDSLWFRAETEFRDGRFEEVNKI
jgi:hypothetical protein